MKNKPFHDLKNGRDQIRKNATQLAKNKLVRRKMVLQIETKVLENVKIKETTNLLAKMDKAEAQTGVEITITGLETYKLTPGITEGAVTAKIILMIVITTDVKVVIVKDLPKVLIDTKEINLSRTDHAITKKIVQDISLGDAMITIEMTEVKTGIKNTNALTDMVVNHVRLVIKRKIAHLIL